MTAARDALWLTEADVCAVLELDGAIEVLSAALEDEALGEAQNMAKTHVAWGGGSTLHALGAIQTAAGFAGTKTWAHTEGGASPLLILYDAKTGALAAVIEAFALGQLRTSATSAVATRWLARPEADVLAIIGTGKQALMQVAAVAAVRPLREIRVFSPTPGHRAAFVARLETAFNTTAIDAPSLDAAVGDAAIITLVTRATEPFLTADLVDTGAHINAVGAIVPSRAEFAPDLLSRCGRVVVDSLPAVQSLSHELRVYYGQRGSWSDVIPLCRIVHDAAARPDDTDLTLFKAMGMGLSDVALGTKIYERARARGLGRHVPQPVKVSPERLLGRERSRSS